MPQWIHNRAYHLMAKNPDMPKGQAFAIATEQSHATGHTPKSYGTTEAKQEAKAKYDEPKKHYEQTADPEKSGKQLEHAEDSAGVKIAAFFDELHKIASLGGLIENLPPNIFRTYGVKRTIERGERHRKATEHAIEQGYPAGWVALRMHPRPDLPY
jgi:hypothetical protein